MAARREKRGLPPSHPGAYLREDILPALGMTITDLAKHLGVSRTALSQVVNEKHDVSVIMAQRLGQAFGTGSRFWIALQMHYDLWQAEQLNSIAVERLRWNDGEAA